MRSTLVLYAPDCRQRGKNVKAQSVCLSTLLLLLLLCPQECHPLVKAQDLHHIDTITTSRSLRNPCTSSTHLEGNSKQRVHKFGKLIEKLPTKSQVKITDAYETNASTSGYPNSVSLESFIPQALWRHGDFNRKNLFLDSWPSPE